jgi:succinyl-diaminopimelate desuccinylase
MKSAVAAFAVAAARHSKKQFRGSISLLITGDEEGPAVNGTAKVLEWLAQKGERIDHCVVGEPTGRTHAGDTIKIGRRGSLRAEITVHGVQGHTAYPQNALNPIPVLCAIVSRLAGEALDTGTAHFPPSTLAFTTFDVGNNASNVSPASARAAASIRFNDLQTPEILARHIEACAAEVTHAMGGTAHIEISVGALPFLTVPGPFTDLLERAIRSATGRAVELSTTGGTSDARFIKNYCPVAEVGLAGATMHKTNECVPLMEIESLTAIYASILDVYFAAPPESGL